MVCTPALPQTIVRLQHCVAFGTFESGLSFDQSFSCQRFNPDIKDVYEQKLPSAGCKYELQVSEGSCYASMTYHLVQPPSSAPIIIKDEAWYLRHLRDIVDLHLKKDPSTYRNFYLFDHK